MIHWLNKLAVTFDTAFVPVVLLFSFSVDIPSCHIIHHARMHLAQQAYALMMTTRF
jgi:hypothetical protein